MMLIRNYWTCSDARACACVCVQVGGPSVHAVSTSPPNTFSWPQLPEFPRHTGPTACGRQKRHLSPSQARKRGPSSGHKSNSQPKDGSFMLRRKGFTRMTCLSCPVHPYADTAAGGAEVLEIPWWLSEISKHPLHKKSMCSHSSVQLCCQHIEAKQACTPNASRWRS